MNNTAFRLKDAYFSYTGKREDAVLRIDQLDIPRGKVVFILGASGLGKSTLLEGLGLMNNTLCAGQMEFLNQKGDTLEMGKAWADERKLFQIRKEYFSFIFQNTNLMENFSAYENISLPVMIQSDTGQLKAYESAERYMREVGLPVDMVGFEKKSSALSGGQRQRLSFVRALNSEFEVLFCDEPTGNLDQFNARELFQIIRRSIGPEQTAIIVSHDIDLALTYADVILCLSKKDGIGVLEPQHTFLPDAANREKVREVILELYASRMVVRKEATQIPSDLQKRLGKARFENLFRLREGASINGKKWMNLWILTAIFTVTFLAIGFSNGSIRYLQEKMNNPFVQWITIQIPYSLEPQYVDSLVREFRTGPVHGEYEIKSISDYFVSSGIFVQKQAGGKKSVERARGRTFSFESGKPDPILVDLLNTQNLVKGFSQPFPGENSMGVVVTRKLLKDIGLSPEDAHFLPLQFQIYNEDSQQDEQVTIPIPIRSVVKDIVGKIDLGYTKEFKAALRDNEGMFNPYLYRSLVVHMAEDKEAADKVHKELVTWFKAHPEFKPVVKKVRSYSEGFVGGFTCKILFEDHLFARDFLDKTWASISALPSLKSYKLTRIYDFTEGHNEPLVQAKSDYLSLNFSNLDKIEPFSEYLLSIGSSDKDYLLEVDTSRVKEKKNFNFLSKILLVVAFLLVTFAVVSICLYISNLLTMHLEKVRMNIGTFMAFGLAGGRVQSVYFQIILRFILVSMGLGFAGSLLLGLGLDQVMILLVKEEEVQFYKIWDWSTLWISVAVVGIAFFFSWLTIRRMLARTPGDLIYNR